MQWHSHGERRFWCLKLCGSWSHWESLQWVNHDTTAPCTHTRMTPLLWEMDPYRSASYEAKRPPFGCRSSPCAGSTPRDIGICQSAGGNVCSPSLGGPAHAALRGTCLPKARNPGTRRHCAIIRVPGAKHRFHSQGHRHSPISWGEHSPPIAGRASASSAAGDVCPPKCYLMSNGLEHGKKRYKNLSPGDIGRTVPIISPKGKC